VTEHRRAFKRGIMVAPIDMYLPFFSSLSGTFPGYCTRSLLCKDKYVKAPVWELPIASYSDQINLSRAFNSMQ
jgi:hypothetical protein